MPVRPIGRGCFQWGHHGKVYCGPGARAKAERQGRAAHARGYVHDVNRSSVNRAVARVLSQPPVGWGVVLETIPFDRSDRPRARWVDRHRYPVRAVRVADLVATQQVVGREKVVEYLEDGWREPILVEPHPGKLLIVDGHHRAYAASLLGDETIDAYVAPAVGERVEMRERLRDEVDRWQDALVPGDARYVPAAVRAQMPDAVDRALAAGAPTPLEFMGAGMTGVVFCAGDVAYKVARDTRPIDHQFFEEEAEWLAAAARVPEVAPHVARFHDFDPANLVIVRDCPRADPEQSAWRYGEDKLFDLHRRIERAMVPNGWTAPEFKPDSYVLTVDGPVLVDASMPSRVGDELTRYVEDVVAGSRTLWRDSPTDLAFAVRREVGQKTLSKAEADRLEALIAERWPENRVESTRRRR